MIAVAILLPWLALMLRGRVFQAIICLILQCTLLGWIPAAIWAIMVVSGDSQERRHKEMIETIEKNKNVVGYIPSQSQELVGVQPVDFDRKKWDALVRYDEELQRAVDVVRPYGQHFVDLMANDFLALSDKAMLPKIMAKVVQEARQSKEVHQEYRYFNSNVFVSKDHVIIGLKEPIKFICISKDSALCFNNVAEMESAVKFSGDRELVSGAEKKVLLDRYKNDVLQFC